MEGIRKGDTQKKEKIKAPSKELEEQYHPQTTKKTCMGSLKEHASEIQKDGGNKSCLRLIKPAEKRGP